MRRTMYLDRSDKVWWIGVIGALAASAWAAGANPPATNARMVAMAPAAAPSTAHVMDAPLRLIAEAAQTYQNVQDYTCLFLKTEQINGQLQPENVIAMKVRSQPFSVYMRWLGPKPMVGQEVCYVAGRNNGMMRVHATGLRGAVGFVSLDPRDPRALQNNRHAITEAGIGNLIGRLQQSWEAERRFNKTQVRIADYDFNKRKCTRVETIHPDNSGRQFYSYRTVVYLDKETRLPIRLEAYDWPRAGGAPEGDLLECYSYIDLRFNVGLGEDAFRY